MHQLRTCLNYCRTLRFPHFQPKTLYKSTLVRRTRRPGPMSPSLFLGLFGGKYYNMPSYLPLEGNCLGEQGTVRYVAVQCEREAEGDKRRSKHGVVTVATETLHQDWIWIGCYVLLLGANRWCHDPDTGFTSQDAFVLAHPEVRIFLSHRHCALFRSTLAKMIINNSISSALRIDELRIVCPGSGLTTSLSKESPSCRLTSYGF